MRTATWVAGADLAEETGRLRLGDPLVPTADVGPMVAEAQRAREELQAGTVWFNDPPKRLAHYRVVRPDRLQGSRGLGHARPSLTDNDAGPFGGMKMSGNARELGPERLEGLETKHVHLDGRQPQALVVSVRPGGLAWWTVSGARPARSMEAA